MSTTQKVLNFFGDSETLSSFNFMTWREFLLQMRPDFQASGTVADVKIGPQSYSAAVRSLWHGANRSYSSATNGITIDGMTAVVAARLAAPSPAATHAIVHLGMNDGLGGDSSATMLSDIDALVGAMHTAVPALKILVMGVINQLLNPTAQTQMTAYNAGLAAALAARSAYCWTKSPPALTSEDFGDIQQVHMNGRGNLKFAIEVNAAPAAFWT